MSARFNNTPLGSSILTQFNPGNIANSLNGGNPVGGFGTSLFGHSNFSGYSIFAPQTYNDAAVATRVTWNPDSTYGRIIYVNSRINPNPQAYNGAIDTRPNYRLGNFSNRYYLNAVDNADPNGYNIEFSGRDSIMRRRFPWQYSYDPYEYYHSNVYPNGITYPVDTYYRGIVPQSREYFDNYYGSEYPPAAPECMPHLNCRGQRRPNDCRSCVSAQGGSSHCVDQICGPHRI